MCPLNARLAALPLRASLGCASCSPGLLSVMESRFQGTGQARHSPVLAPSQRSGMPDIPASETFLRLSLLWQHPAKLHEHEDASPEEWELVRLLSPNLAPIFPLSSSWAHKHPDFLGKGTYEPSTWPDLVLCLWNKMIFTWAQVTIKGE